MRQAGTRAFFWLLRVVRLMNQTQKQNLKRRNTPRLPIVYTTADILQKLDYLAEKYGSEKAAIEAAISALYCAEEQK